MSRDNASNLNLGIAASFSVTTDSIRSLVKFFTRRPVVIGFRRLKLQINRLFTFSSHAIETSNRWIWQKVTEHSGAPFRVLTLGIHRTSDIAANNYRV